jgi:hypothetical protein
MKLGTIAQDKITGFEGRVTGHCDYISGCNQSLLQPAIDKDGKFQEAHWFDDQRLVLLDAEPLRLDNSKTPGPDKPAPIR